MLVSLDFLIEIAKVPGDRSRSFTVTDPLPADARIVGLKGNDELGLVHLRLESAEWDGDDAMVAPKFTVHFGPEAVA